MGEGHRLQVVDVVLQFIQVDPHQSEGLAEIVQNRVCSSIYRHTIKTCRLKLHLWLRMGKLKKNTNQLRRNQGSTSFQEK